MASRSVEILVNISKTFKADLLMLTSLMLSAEKYSSQVACLEWTIILDLKTRVNFNTSCLLSKFKSVSNEKLRAVNHLNCSKVFFSL